jgi:hypothetical protein
MKLPKTVHKNLFVVLVASLLLLGGLSAALKPTVDTWGEAVGGLQMTIYLDQAEGVPSKVPKFRVELRNAGRNDLVVNDACQWEKAIPKRCHLDSYRCAGKISAA